MDEESHSSERPPDEAWWERELHRNEKLMDKYMAVLGDNPDWDKWQNPEDLYNKVHFGIDPPEQSEDEATAEDAAEVEADSASEEDEDELSVAAQPEWMPSEEEVEAALQEEDPDDDPEVNGDYAMIATQARKFACAVFDLEKTPGDTELLFLSAGKVGANLAGGHGLGYDEESICGNVVKCRWALSDCEFCREMLEQFHAQTGEQRYAELAADAQKLGDGIRDRIAFLRKRIWW